MSIATLVFVKDDELTYYLFLDRFDFGVKVILFISSLFILTVSISVLNKTIAGMILIYLITGVVLLRNLRYLNIGNVSKKISRYNFIINFLLVLTSLVISLEKIRLYLFSFISLLYQRLVDLFFYLFYWFFIIVGVAFDFLSKYIKNNIKSNNKIIPKASDVNKIKELAEARLKDSNYYFVISLIVKTFIILVFVIIVFKIIKRVAYKPIKTEFYKDEREFIYDGKIKENILKKVVEVLKPKNNNDVVRIYYSKLLKKLQGLIEIKASDTSMSIKAKSDSYIERAKNQEIRDIYIRARYSEDLIDDSRKNVFINMIRNIKFKK